MDTTRNILAIVVAVVLLVLGFELVLVAAVGLGTGLLAGAGVAAIAVALYVAGARPWHRRWGATDAEVAAPMPGDDLVPEASATTRAVAIDAPPGAVWPWIVQIGWGRAGWYSYDWIDNDGEPSAEVIVPECQRLAAGDRIPMTPDLGFVVQEVDPPRSLVALSDDGSTSWCLRVVPAVNGSRLVSRFRSHPARGVGAVLQALVVDPGAFLMERRMLLGLAARAERDPAEQGVLVPLPGAGSPDATCEPVGVDEAEAFLDRGRLAVIGASDDRGNMGGAILRELWLHGHDVVPVHPTARTVGGHRCFPTIAAVPDPVDGAVVVVPADAAVAVVQECIAAGVPAVWLFKGIGGEGAASERAIALCREAGIVVVPGACPLMFTRPVGTVHRIHRAVRRARHDVVAR